jgi:hypothetical protein
VTAVPRTRDEMIVLLRDTLTDEEADAHRESLRQGGMVVDPDQCAICAVIFEGKTIANDATVFQGLVVKAGSADVDGRLFAIARGLAMIAYALCDIADAIRQVESSAPISRKAD